MAGRRVQGAGQALVVWACEAFIKEGAMAIDMTPEKLLLYLKENDLTLLVIKDEKVVFRSKDEGLRTLALVVKEKPELLKDAVVVDKVVGAAAAILFVSTRPKQVIGAVMSLGGQERLAREEIAPYARELIEMLMDEKREMLDPMEAKAMGDMKAEEIVAAVLQAN